MLALLLITWMAAVVKADSPANEPDASNPAAAGDSKTYTLEECLNTALKESHRRPASQFAVAMAEAQHRQALAGYWPQLNFRGGYQRLDEALNFLFPASTIPVAAQSMTIPGGTMVVSIPAGALAPGFPPSPMQMPVNFPAQTVNTPAQTFRVPEQNVKVLDRDVATGTVDLKWLLYDGGMRRGWREQAGGLVDIMRQEARRTDLEIVDTVKQYYWGAVLAQQLRKLGDDTLARMEVTLHLTESLYKEGAGKVTKADYLDNLVMVESVRSMVAQLEKNEKMAQAALANTMGMPWTASAKPSASEIPFDAYAGKLEDLVGTSYRFSPDWGKLEAGLRAAEGAVRTAKSEYYPKLALTGELHRWWNNGYSAGMATAQNRAGWTGGVGIEVPIFNGFLTRNKVSEALARVKQLKENEFLLREGLGLQIKNLFLGLEAAVKADDATSKAMKAAQDNQDLNTRAYENGLVETEKVIRAQLVEALMSAQHYAARYQYVALLSQLSLVVGTEVRAKLGPTP
ncbi:MAG: TolC family protein [Bryobacteraceae bacterium]